ncbi:MAG: hypothetical protein DRJ01_07175, partial [Bacteroidetes bacterium]
EESHFFIAGDFSLRRNDKRNKRFLTYVRNDKGNRGFLTYVRNDKGNKGFRNKFEMTKLNRFSLQKIISIFFLSFLSKMDLD